MTQSRWLERDVVHRDKCWNTPGPLSESATAARYRWHRSHLLRVVLFKGSDPLKASDQGL